MQTSNITDVSDVPFSKESNGLRLFISPLDKPLVDTVPVQTADEPSLRREKQKKLEEWSREDVVKGAPSSFSSVSVLGSRVPGRANDIRARGCYQVPMDS